MSQVLSGTTVLVTGSAGGLGKAIAVGFLEAGANVVVCDINKERLEGAQAELAPRFGDKLLARVVDATADAAVEQLFKETVDRFGHLDVLVNNAGVTDVFDPAGTLSRELWDRVLNVNLTGPFLTTKAAIKTMEPRSSGTIINIGSNAAFYGSNAGLAYTVTKHGVLGLTRNTAAFYGDKGIYCIMLQLGAMLNTNISDIFANGMNADGMALMQKNFPGLKPGENDVQLETVAKFCVFLANRDIAKTMNGASVPLNCNWPAA